MAAGLVAALITAGVLGMWFSTTRVVAITAIAALTFIFPWLGVLVLATSIAAFWLFRFRK